MSYLRDVLTDAGVASQLNSQSPMTRDLQFVLGELDRATAKFGPFASKHEGYAVLLEEMDELWQAVKHEGPDEVRVEAIQVAAMALRFLRDCC